MSIVKCPFCQMYTLGINYKVARPYAYIFCYTNCGFTYGMQHKLLDLPEGKEFTGLSVIDLPLIPVEDQKIVKYDCLQRFQNQMIKAQEDNFKDAWHLAPFPLPRRLVVRLNYTFGVLKQIWKQLQIWKPKKQPTDYGSIPF